MLKRHQIQVPRGAGHKLKQIAKKTEVSERSARRIAKESPVVARAARRVGRPSTVESFRKSVENILAKDPEILTVEVVRLVRDKGYDGGKSALYDLVRSLRRVEAKPLVRGLIHSFEAFGGVPLVSVFDNPKTVVLFRKDRVIEWNATFGQAALDLRFAPELCWPRRANQKGAVENLVGRVKSSFFKVRRFHDREDLQRQLREWLEETNTTRASRATGVIPAERLADERERLRPLPFKAEEYALRFPIMVGPTGLVDFDGYRYSMPPRAIGIPGTLFLFPEKVRIAAGRHEAWHPRFPAEGKTSYRAEDRAATLAAVSGERARLYSQRQQILELGGAAEAFLTEIVHRRPRTWKGDVERLYDLLLHAGPKALLAAIGRATTKRLFGAEHVAEIVEEAA